MRRKIVSSIAVILFAGTTASAQFNGGAGLGTTDCSNPLNALSSACTGSSGSTFGGGGQQPGQGAYGQPLYGQQFNGASQSQQSGASQMLPNSGINNRVPTYVDQIPYGNGMTGAYRNSAGGYSSIIPRPQPPTEFQRIVAGA
ncbi:MAG: hypothetical protein ABI164_03770, partial [Acidobacteriaceae bacterium]